MKRLCAAFVLALVGEATTAETLTLDRALELALERDARVQEREHLVDAAAALISQVDARGDWMLNLNAFVGIAPGVEGGPFEGGGCMPGACELRDDRFDPDGLSPWFNLQFTLVKPLYTFGKIESYREAAAANVAVKQGDVEIQRVETALQVKQAYFGLLAARDTRLLLEDVRQRIADASALVEQWLESGEVEIKQSDLYALQSGQGLVSKYLAQAQGLENVARAGLRLLTGIEGDAPLELADTRLKPVDLPASELAELQQLALGQRAEMRQVDAGLKALRALVEARRAEAKPNVYAGVAGAAAYAPGRDDLDNPYISDPFNDYGASPLLGVQWGWQRGVAAAQASQAQAELNALIAKSALARQGIPFEVAEQFHQARAHREAVDRLAEAAQAARRWMVTSYADFEAGLEETDKIVAAFQGYVLAQTEYLRTVYDYNMFVARLQKVIGASS